MLATDGNRKRFIRFAGIEGISDIVGVLRPAGRALAVECKIRPNRPTPQQWAFLKAVDAAGGLAVVAYSVDDVIAAVEAVGG